MRCSGKMANRIKLNEKANVECTLIISVCIVVLIREEEIVDSFAFLIGQLLILIEAQEMMEYCCYMYIFLSLDQALKGER